MNFSVPLGKEGHYAHKRIKRDTSLGCSIFDVIVLPIYESTHRTIMDELGRHNFLKDINCYTVIRSVFFIEVVRSRIYRVRRITHTHNCNNSNCNNSSNNDNSNCSNNSNKICDKCNLTNMSSDWPNASDPLLF